MNRTRREMLKATAAVWAGLTLEQSTFGASPGSQASEPKIGMCDWSLGARAELEVFDRAKKVGLDGVMVSIGTYKIGDHLLLRDPDRQKKYIEAASNTGVEIRSLAMGILNHVAMKSEPVTALWIADAIEVAKNIGAKNILLPCFGVAEIDEKNDKDMKRVTEVMQELAPHAEKAGVILGLENTISAEANMKILNQVKSPFVQVYYDVYNLVGQGKDPVHEIKLLGKKNICDIHFKEAYTYLGATGKVDWKAVMLTLKEIGYENWYVLETSNPSKDWAADTQRNIKYLKDLYHQIRTA